MWGSYMKDEITNAFCSYKEFAMEMASSCLGLAISKMLLHNQADQDEDIESIMEYLIAYDYGYHYEDSICRSSSYHYYRYYNLPTTLNIIKRGTEKGLLSREKWMPCLELFFEKTKEFLDVIPEGYDDYLKYLETLKSEE